MTPFQKRLTEVLKKHSHVSGGLPVFDIAQHMKSNYAACTSGLRAMERRGEAGTYVRGIDRWSTRFWFLTGGSS